MPTLLIDDAKNVEEADRVCRTYDEGITVLQGQIWDILYLGYDLGDPDPYKTGYGVCCWLERHPECLPKKVILVTNNSSGRKNMVLALRKMYPEDFLRTQN